MQPNNNPVWSGKMPDGRTTNNRHDYMKAWHDFAHPICEATNAKLMSYDPDVVFRWGPDTGAEVEKTLTLPTDFVATLNEVLKAGKGR